MASSAAWGSAPSLAQPTINAIQQQITALLPGSLAAAVTAQFASAPAGGGSLPADPGSMPVQPSTVGMMLAMAFSPGSGSGASSSMGASPAQPTIDAIQQQITALLPSSLASAITSQFAGAPAMGQAVLPTPAAASAALAVPLGDPASAFLSLPQTM